MVGNVHTNRQRRHASKKSVDGEASVSLGWPRMGKQYRRGKNGPFGHAKGDVRWTHTGALNCFSQLLLRQ